MKQFLFLSLMLMSGFIFASEINQNKPDHNDTTIIVDIDIDKANKLLSGGQLAGKAELIEQIAIEYQISPHFMFGIIGQESGYGKSSQARNKNNFGGIKNRSGKYVSFESPEAGLRGMAENIKKHYHNKGIVSVHNISGKWVHGTTKKTDHKWTASVKSIGNKISINN